MTGFELGKYFDQKVDIAYTGYLDPTKKNRVIKNGIFICTDRKYSTLLDQKTFDEMNALITTEQAFSVNNNQIYTSALQITSVTNVGTTVTVTTFFPHNLIVGDSMTTSGIAGFTTNNPNQTAAVVTTPTPTTFTFVAAAAPTGAVTPNTGNVVYAKMIADYMHLRSFRTKFIEPQFYQVVKTTGVSPIVIYFSKRTKFRTGSRIRLSGFTNNTGANGDWYCKQLSQLSYALYSDADLQTPSTGGIPYGSPEGAVAYIWDEYTKPLFSDNKIDAFLRNITPDDPMHEVANKLIKFYPRTRVCESIVVDYIKVPAIFPDVNDQNIDLSLYYPDKFLYYIIDAIIKLFSIPTRDVLLNQEITAEIVQNP